MSELNDPEVTQEIHSILGNLAANSPAPVEFDDDVVESVIRNNVRNGRPTSPKFVGLLLDELDKTRKHLAQAQAWIEDHLPDGACSGCLEPHPPGTECEL